jgi:hypothetical protein
VFLLFEKYQSALWRSCGVAEAVLGQVREHSSVADTGLDLGVEARRERLDGRELGPFEHRGK